jgi:hypothetical protein
MRSSIPFVAICLLAATLLTLPVHAQCTIAGGPAIPGIPPTPPVLGAPAFWALNGFAPGSASTWSYRLSGFHVTPQLFVSAVGRFTASVGVTSRAPGVQQGLILSSISVNLGGTMYNVLLPVGGTFQVDSDCTGGTIQLASGTNPGTVRTVRFVFYNGGNSMYLVSTDNDGVVLDGNATRM